MVVLLRRSLSAAEKKRLLSPCSSVRECSNVPVPNASCSECKNARECPKARLVGGICAGAEVLDLTSNRAERHTVWCVIVQQLVPVLVFLFFLIFRDAWTRIVRLYIHVAGLGHQIIFHTTAGKQ